MESAAGGDQLLPPSSSGKARLELPFLIHRPPPPPPNPSAKWLEENCCDPPPLPPNVRIVSKGTPEFEIFRENFKKYAERARAKCDSPVYREDPVKAAAYLLRLAKEYSAIALDYYNATTKGPEYELVEAIGRNDLVSVGFFFHVCFTAKPKPKPKPSAGPDAVADADADAVADASPKHFFAELSQIDGEKKCIFCCIVDPDSPDTVDGCGSCPPNEKMYHRKGGYQAGNYPYKVNAGWCPEGYYDESVPMERRLKFTF